MAADKGTQLRQKADESWGSKKFDQALVAYTELAGIEPTNKTHRVRIADCLVQLGRKDEAIGVYREVAEELARDGRLVAAISVNKMILGVDPNETDTQKRLAALYSRRGVATVAAKAEAAARAGATKDAVVQEVVTADQVMGGWDWDFEAAEESGLELDDNTRTAETGVQYRPSVVKPKGLEPEITGEHELPLLELSLDDAVVEDTVNAAVAETKAVLNAALDTNVDQLLGQVDDFPAVPPTPLFSDLEPEQFERVIDMLTTTRVESGTVICKEGDAASAMYIIAFGKVRVITEDAAGQTIILAEMASGDFFGEVALVEGGYRTATVLAVEETELLVFSKDGFDTIVAEYPIVRDVLRMFYHTRTADTYLAKSELFGTLTKEERWALVGAMQLWRFPAGAPIVRQGQAGGAMFLVRVGSVRVYSGEGKDRRAITDLGPGDVFGEISVVSLMPRTATVAAVRDTQVFCLERDAARRAFALNPELGRKVKQIIEERIARAP